MLFQPTFYHPYLEAVDALSPINTFSCLINSGKLVAYKLDIYNTNNDLVYTTGKTTQGTDSQLPIFGNKGESSFLFVTIPDGIGIVNGGDYKWVLTQWEDVNESSPSPSVWVAYGRIYASTSQVNTTTVIYTRPHANVNSGMYIQVNGATRKIESYTLDSSAPAMWGRVQLKAEDALPFVPIEGTNYKITKDWLDNLEHAYPFYTRSQPVISINPFGVIDDGITYINASSLEITADYSQAEGVPLKHYRFILSNNNAVIFDTGEVYRQDLVFEYDGYLNGETYDLALKTENQMGVVSNQSVSFRASYAQTIVPIAPVATMDNSECCAVVDFSNAISILGKTNGDEGVDYNYTDDGVQIDYNTHIYWDELNGVGDLKIPNAFTIVLKTRINEGYAISPIEIETDFGVKYSVWYDGSRFYYRIDGEDEQSYVPYLNFELNGSVGQVPDSQTLYMWDDSGVWGDGLFWTDNDIASIYYWYVVCLPDHVQFIKGGEWLG